jgi:hypothetical protein
LPLSHPVECGFDSSAPGLSEYAFGWWRRKDLNLQSPASKTGALPVELLLFEVVGVAGFEPAHRPLIRTELYR